MSQENTEILRRGFQAFNRTGEIDASFLADDFELHQSSSIIDTAGVFRGPDALRESLRELQQVFEDLSMEPERFVPAAGGMIVVVMQVRGRGRGSGVELSNRVAWVCSFRNREVARIVVFEEPEEALKAAGLSE